MEKYGLGLGLGFGNGVEEEEWPLEVQIIYFVIVFSVAKDSLVSVNKLEAELGLRLLYLNQR